MQESLGSRLREARKNAGISQTQVSKLTGIAQNVLSDYEHDLHEPKPSRLQTLAELYAVSVDWLLGKVCEDDVFAEVRSQVLTLAPSDRAKLIRIIASTMEK